MKKVFLFLIFLFFVNFVFAADINYASVNNGAEINEIDFLGSPIGILSGIINEDGTSTYWGRHSSVRGTPTLAASAYFTSEIIFDKTAQVLDSVQYWHAHAYNCAGLNGQGTNFEVAIQILSEGSWKELVAPIISGTIIQGPWDEVSKIRATIRTNAVCDTPFHFKTTISATATLYEIEAIGPEPISFQDSGLKIQVGGQEISIAAEINEADSKLKFRNNGQTYGLALIDSSSPDFGGVDDSMVRVRIDGVTYALRKYS